MIKTIRIRALLAVLVGMVGLTAHARPDSVRVYDGTHPLMYEDVWDLWPYSFLDENGQAQGFNIDLIHMMMRELGIKDYKIKLKQSAEVFDDLKNGRADLTLGLAVGFHDQFGQYSRNSVTLFTQSVVTPKSKAVAIKNFSDLEKNRVIVNDGSMCHHLMIDYGWEQNAVPVEDMREAIQKVSATEEGQIVWNTLSLKWLMRRYHTDNLELTPVNMPHGQYKFMSNDTVLLDRLDDAFSQLYAADKITPIQDKWFYPDKQKKPTPVWVWYLLGALGLLAIFFLVYTVSYRHQAMVMRNANARRNKRLALILETSRVRIWTYDVKTSRFTWRNENGQAAYSYDMDEFAQRYSPEDFQRLRYALMQLSSLAKPHEGEHEEQLTLELQARDTESGDDSLHDFVMGLSVLERDREGRPLVIIGTKKDVTDERRKQRLADERTLRYQSIFHSPLVGIMLFGPDGLLKSINPKACELFGCKAEEILAERVTLTDILDTGDLTPEQMDGFCATQVVNLDRLPQEERRVRSIRRGGRLYNEFHLLTAYDDAHQLLGVFAMCRDMSAKAESVALLRQGERQLQLMRQVRDDYAANIDSVLDGSDLRLVVYSPQSHTLTVYSSSTRIQHALTQTRCMTLVDNRSKNTAMRLLNDMDGRADKLIEASIGTTLRTPERLPLELYFRLEPQHEPDGTISSYLGLLRDVSLQRDVELQTAIETAKVQEVENTKNMFVKNMAQEIRQPMNVVLDYANRLDERAPSPDEQKLLGGIMENAEQLLHLIDNILYLSRLEAHMIELKHEPADLARLFESMCAEGWGPYMNSATRYVAESSYDQLVIALDTDSLGQAIRQITANAAQHTKSGFIRARYDYIGRRLSIFIEDTGEGIPADELERINQRDASNTQNTKGLGLAITRELVRQMGGNFEVSSEIGSGTTVYINIPCVATVAKRKKWA